MTRQKTRSARGFSLLEILFVVAILSIVMAVVFTQTDLVQKRYRVEDSKMDMTQESREFMDMISRDLRNMGYPTKKMFSPGTLGSPAENDSKVAVGLVKAAYDEIWFEGDVDGDGQVDVIDYRLQAGSTGNCPCRISRSQVFKQNGVAPTSQTNNSYTIELNDVVNSGGAAGAATETAKWTISGYTGQGGTVTNDTAYSTYKNANLFTFYDSNGNEVLPADISTAAGKTAITSIKSIRVNINVLARASDMRSGMRPVMSYSEAVRVSSF